MSSTSERLSFTQREAARQYEQRCIGHFSYSFQAWLRQWNATEDTHDIGARHR